MKRGPLGDSLKTMNGRSSSFRAPHRLTDLHGASQCVSGLGEEFAILENPGLAFPDLDVAPMARKQHTLTSGLGFVLLDMDGTVSLTEDLCCQAMEEMLRRMSGMGFDQWPGLDRLKDYPALIGYSGLKNFQYLTHVYGNMLSEPHSVRAYIEAAAWNMGRHADPEVRESLGRRWARPDLLAVSADPRFAALRDGPGLSPPESGLLVDGLAQDFGERLRRILHDDQAHLGLTIYSENYHRRLSACTGAPEAAQLLPTPGVGLFMALVKGSLGADVRGCTRFLMEMSSDAPATSLRGSSQERLEAMARLFSENPARVALVTSSSAYEAGHVLRHVFHRLSQEAEIWGLGDHAVRRIQGAFADPARFFDVIVTSGEIPATRLKPHRDPYALALRRLGVASGGLARVVGFEDTEPGIVSLRCAGVGLAVALPLAETAAHDFGSAAHVVRGGFPEVILRHGLFLA